MYYKLDMVMPDSSVVNIDKIDSHNCLIEINRLLLIYGFSKEISTCCFNNIRSRPNLLPDRVKWLLNNHKLVIDKYNN